MNDMEDAVQSGQLDIAGVYGQLIILRQELLRLAPRVQMSTDDSNVYHRDPIKAMAAAISGLDQAVESLAWMETIQTHVKDEYPAHGGHWHAPGHQCSFAAETPSWTSETD